MSSTNTNSNSNSNSHSNFTQCIPIQNSLKQVTSVTNNKSHLHARHIEQSTYQICR
jgi:hypothetical protein